MNHVFKVKPNSLDELKSVMRDLAYAMDPDIIKKACGSVRSRF